MDVVKLVGVDGEVVELTGVGGVEGELVSAGADHALVGDGEVSVEDTVDFLAAVLIGPPLDGGQKRLPVEMGRYFAPGGVEG